MEKRLLPACPCWWQLTHVDKAEDARVLLHRLRTMLANNCKIHKLQVTHQATQLYNTTWQACPTGITCTGPKMRQPQLIVFLHSVSFFHVPKPSQVGDNQTNQDKDVLPRWVISYQHISTLTMSARWREEHVACKKLVPQIQKVYFWETQPKQE